MANPDCTIVSLMLIKVALTSLVTYTHSGSGGNQYGDVILTTFFSSALK